LRSTGWLLQPLLCWAVFPAQEDRLLVPRQIALPLGLPFACWCPCSLVLMDTDDTTHLCLGTPLHTLVQRAPWITEGKKNLPEQPKPTKPCVGNSNARARQVSWSRANVARDGGVLGVDKQGCRAKTFSDCRSAWRFARLYGNQKASVPPAESARESEILNDGARRERESARARARASTIRRTVLVLCLRVSEHATAGTGR
jgi:hypothetical protein